jgi:hypothetical protein
MPGFVRNRGEYAKGRLYNYTKPWYNLTYTSRAGGP